LALSLTVIAGALVLANAAAAQTPTSHACAFFLPSTVEGGQFVTTVGDDDLGERRIAAVAIRHYPPVDESAAGRLRAATVAWAAVLGELHAVGFPPLSRARARRPG
jgi:hypothetical protein